MAELPHARLDAPSGWVRRWAGRIASGGAVLDVAAGGGRHARFLASLGHPVDAVDRDEAAIAALAGVPGVAARCADIEAGAWPYAGRRFAGVIITNYLHRPLFPRFLDALAPGGVLIYETFAAGNEQYGRPSNPDFLLRRGELLELAFGRLSVIAYEDTRVDEPRPAMVQRLCAVHRGHVRT